MSLKDKVSLYEIIELDNGDVALQRAEEQSGEPLVSIRFSEESSFFLDDAKLEVAKAMIEAGLDVVSEIHDVFDPDETNDLDAEPVFH